MPAVTIPQYFNDYNGLIGTCVTYFRTASETRVKLTSVPFFELQSIRRHW